VLLQKLLPRNVSTQECPPPGSQGNDAGTSISNGQKRAPAGYHDDDGYIVPYDVMLGVLARSHDDTLPPRESTKL